MFVKYIKWISGVVLQVFRRLGNINNAIYKCGLNNREVTVWQSFVMTNREEMEGFMQNAGWLDRSCFTTFLTEVRKTKLTHYGHWRTFRSVHWANHWRHTKTMGYLQLKYNWRTNVSAYRMLLHIPYVRMSNKLPNWKPHVNWELQ